MALPPLLQGMPHQQQFSLGGRIARGAAWGAGAGALLIGIGLIRAFFVVLGGRRIEALAGKDLRVLAFYVGGFAIGGATFGALRPLLRGTVGIYVGCMLVGVIVMLAIALGDQGKLGALDAVDWVALPAMGMLFGGAVAYGYTRSRR